MSDATKILAAFAIFVIGLGFFLGIFATALNLIAKFGGWSKLAKRYGTTQPPPQGPRRTFQSLRFGKLGRYNNALTFIFSTQGFYISTWGPFRFGHIPLLIPWSDIHNVSARKILLWNCVEFQIGQPSVATVSLTVNRATFETLNEYLPLKLPGLRFQ